MYGIISSSSDSDSESKDRLRAGGHPLYFNNDKDVPIFHSDKCTYTTDEIVKILWSATEDQFKCRKPPKKVQQNAVFLIDPRYTSLEDLQADGLPQYDMYGGKRTLTVEVDDADADDMKVLVTRRAKDNLKSNNEYHFERLYHSWSVESGGNKFHRKIMHMRDRRNDILNYVAFVQYVYDGDEENIIDKPHQNTKKGRAPGYTRRKASVIREIDTNLSSMGPKEAVF